VLLFPRIMKPLFELGVVIQPCTAAVASMGMNVSTVVTGTDVATAAPADIPEFPLTVNSVHGVEALTTSTLIVPASPTWSRNRVNVALWIWAAVSPAGS
jgi:hypothetical protein